VWVRFGRAGDDPAYAHKVFSVLTLYPGGDGLNYTQFFDAQKVGIVAEGAAAGRLSPFILVEPQLQPSVSLDTECTDLAGLPKVGTFMEQDVPAMLRASFRVAPTRSGWGVGWGIKRRVLRVEAAVRPPRRLVGRREPRRLLRY